MPVLVVHFHRPHRALEVTVQTTSCFLDSVEIMLNDFLIPNILTLAEEAMFMVDPSPYVLLQGLFLDINLDLPFWPFKKFYKRLVLYAGSSLAQNSFERFLLSVGEPWLAVLVIRRRQFASFDFKCICPEQHTHI